MNKKPGKSPEKQQPDVSGKIGFPIVGIGASAGGLAAFEALFSSMPADTDPGMGFVLVQHLAPDHKSILTDLIRRYTSMQVFEVEDGMTVHPNCAYIIPPNRDMAFLNGALHLMEPKQPRGLRMPIDFFFRSLAQDQRERAIGIVLSGTGSDGALGVRAIKGEGGMVIAQDPATTEYDGMPRNAIATGLVDYQLPPAEIPAQLIAYVAHAFGQPPKTVAAAPPRTESDLNKIFILLRSQTGHDFSQYKTSTIQRRIDRRMAIQHIETMEGYVKYLQKNPAETETLFRDLLIGVTSFFRDPEAFRALEELVIPKLFAGRAPSGTIRVWVPGCATGEEAYSLAILLARQQTALKQTFKIQVFATDIDGRAIETARAGLYPASVANDLTPERLAHYFLANPESGLFRIHKNIRDLLIFSEQDVIKDPPFSRLDLISCRNLLIYMSTELQKKLIHLFHYALNPGGFLFLGTSETVGEHVNLFTLLDRKKKIYQRKDISRGNNQSLGRFPPSPISAKPTRQPEARKLAKTGQRPLRELAEQTILQQVIPAAALVDDHGNILYLHGRTGLYLEPAPGEAGVNNILKMAREGLKHELTTALHKAIRNRKVVSVPGLRIKTDGMVAVVNLAIHPVATTSTGDTGPPLFLVSWVQYPPEEHLSLGFPGHLQEEDGGNLRIAELLRELQAKEEYLQATNEELETSNEELKSSNEEMQSVNEELQSSNEELETSKEELQSVNEELFTVNTELEAKVDDLNRVNNDMNNLLSGTGIGTVFVDHSLQIIRFTPTVTRIINLIQSDIGRPVGHIVSNLVGYQALVEDIREVLDTLVPKEIEVKSRSGTWYSMRILPYRTLDNVIEGAVITFADISRVKEAQEALRISEARFRAVLKRSSVVVAHIDRDLRYTWIYHPDPDFDLSLALGKRDDQLGQDQGSRQLVELKRQMIQTGQPSRDTISLSLLGMKGIKDYDIALEPLTDESGQVIGATVTAFDITDQNFPVRKE